MTVKATIKAGNWTILVGEDDTVIVKSDTTRFEAGDGYFELRGVGGLIASEGIEGGRIVRKATVE